MRPKKGYSKNKKLKAAKKSLKHAEKHKLEKRTEFWKMRIETLEKKPESKKRG
jgi:chaperonin cofactor prefoldin